MKRILILTNIMLIAGCVSTKPYKTPDTIKEVHTQNAQFNRVFAITHNILIANTGLCSKIRADYGFVPMSLNGTGSKEQNQLWVEALNLQKQPTVTFVAPQSSADRAGLLVGDAIISVNDNSWSETRSQKAFRKQLNEALRAPKLNLGILRSDKQKSLKLIADKACDYSFTLSLTNTHNAMAIDRRIIVDSGAVNLLKHDDELAFFISHELAHILLGHTLPKRRNELADYKIRSAIEKDADALGIRIMIRAGYNTKGAETALRSTGLIDSGPVTNFFNYHGAYMSVEERILYLRQILEQ